MNALTRPITRFQLGFMKRDLGRGARRGGRPRPMDSSGTNTVGREREDGRNSSRDSRNNGNGFPFAPNKVSRRHAFFFNTSRTVRRKISSLRRRRGSRRNSWRKGRGPPMVLRRCVD